MRFEVLLKTDVLRGNVCVEVDAANAPLVSDQLPRYDAERLAHAIRNLVEEEIAAHGSLHGGIDDD